MAETNNPKSQASTTESIVEIFESPAGFWKEKGEYKYTPTYQQEVWRSALQWHESHGDKNALNPKDKNGLPSKGCFQFQDKTFRHYIEKYELLNLIDLDETDWLNWIWDCDLQTEIVNRMLSDKDVAWEQEFPDVVKNKIGLPPK